MNLADTFGAGRDDRALAELVLELYAKIQSHAYPGKWLRENHVLWELKQASFDETPYARELLLMICRKAAYWATVLNNNAAGMAGDAPLEKGFGEKFRIAATTFAHLGESEDWEIARRRIKLVEFPRLSTPRGRKDDQDVVAYKRIWENAKGGYARMAEILQVDSDGAMEDLRSVAPAMRALLDLTEAFQNAYGREKLRLNVADFSDQEHMALELLVHDDGTPTELGRQVSERYVEILVD